MKSSFNAFGRTRDDLGNISVPVWLGKVEPVPVGGTLDAAFLKKGALYPAGCPINITDKVVKPFLVMKITVVSGTTITVKDGGYGIIPEANDYVQLVGNTNNLDTAVKVKSVKVNDTDNTLFEVTLVSALSSATPGGVIVLSSSPSGADMPNAYLYNDIYLGNIDVKDATAGASAAAVMYHQSGILIDRTPAGLIKKLMQVLCSGVYQQND